MELQEIADRFSYCWGMEATVNWKDDGVVSVTVTKNGRVVVDGSCPDFLAEECLFRLFASWPAILGFPISELKH